MFAFALWDRATQSLTLARDRLGEKPLYFGWQRGVLLFGSELKALRAHPAFQGEIDRDALCLFLRMSCIPSPYSIYKNVRKVPPGTFLTFCAGTLHPEPQSFWSMREVAERGQAMPFAGSASDAIAELERLLSESLNGQIVADVPLGAFLSGGIDSSTIVALMQAKSHRPVKTFTIGFHESGYNEAVHAKAVASYLGTEHAELYVTAREAMGVIEKLPRIYDEPFADPSQIPTLLISEMARAHVTVALSGDAGDELFGGYNRYVAGMQILQWLGRMPLVVRRSLAHAIEAVPSAVLDRSARLFGGGEISESVRKLTEIMHTTSNEVAYEQLVSHWKQPSDVVIGGHEPTIALTDPSAWIELSEFEHRMMYMDTTGFLTDDVLVKLDKAAMSSSLETRVPLLDHRIVEFAWSLPLDLKIRKGEGKWILRQVLDKYLPRPLVERPKAGFSVPIGMWLRGPLREWADGLLEESRLRREGFLFADRIWNKWSEHLSGKRNWQYHLWDVLMFQAWLEAETSH
jgi:asparagine synthase (glutamine-hydrolysing)